MNRYNDIIFDFDGTIVDSGEGITRSVQYALKSFGIDEPDRRKLRCFVGPPLKWAFAEYYGFNEQQSAECLRAYREYYLAEGIFQNTVYPGVPEMLDSLKDAGCTRYIASGKPEPFIRKICEHMGLDRYFEFIAGSDLRELHTAKADIIKAAMSVNPDCHSSGVLMVGDRDLDILGAKAAGVASAGILWGGYGTRKEHESAGADYIADTPEQILSIITGK